MLAFWPLILSAGVYYIHSVHGTGFNLAITRRNKMTPQLENAQAMTGLVHQPQILRAMEDEQGSHGHSTNYKLGQPLAGSGSAHVDAKVGAAQAVKERQEQDAFEPASHIGALLLDPK